MGQALPFPLKWLQSLASSCGSWTSHPLGGQGPQNLHPPTPGARGGSGVSTPRPLMNLPSCGPGLIFKKQLKVQVAFGRICFLCLLWLIISGKQTPLGAGEINILACPLGLSPPPGEAVWLNEQPHPKQTRILLQPMCPRLPMRPVGLTTLITQTCSEDRRSHCGTL